MDEMKNEIKCSTLSNKYLKYVEITNTKRANAYQKCPLFFANRVNNTNVFVIQVILLT